MPKTRIVLSSSESRPKIPYRATDYPEISHLLRQKEAKTNMSRRFAK
jgi:hypothetical protein